MADGDAPPQGAPGCPEATQSGLPNIAEALREEIMADVEVRLSQKAASLWTRGQAELRTIEHDRKEIATSVIELQTRQESLITEQKAMHSALLNIATKMEFVAMEMREALRAVGKLDGASAPPGMLPEAFMPPVASPLDMAAELSALCFAANSAFAMEGAEGAPPGLLLQGLCTPPRITPQVAESPFGPAIAPPLPGSPAVLLSLASALPSAAPPAGLTRLHIADCLEMNSSPHTPCDGKAAIGRTGGGSPVSTSANGSSSSTGSPFRVDAGSPLCDVVGASFGCELRPDCVPKDLSSIFPPGLSKAIGGALRADAPAFVPAGSFAT